MEIKNCIMRHSTCFRGTTKGRPVGICWHDTGAGNPWLKRYVQPWEGEANYNSMISLLGKNPNGNDWNHTELQKGVNAFIGKLADGSVATVQTLPIDYRPWGVGKGRLGSLNGDRTGKAPFWIQFEICDDGYQSAEYFHAVYREAVDFTALLCVGYNFDPFGTVVYKGVHVPVITCHKQAHDLGFGDNHGDIMTWFRKFGKTMNNVRVDVKTKMEEILSVTNEECIAAINDALNPIRNQLTSLSAAMNNLSAAMGARLTESQVMDILARRTAAEMVEDLDSAPTWAKPELKTLLETESINGGTKLEVNPEDINLPLTTVKAVLIAKRYADQQIAKLTAPAPGE